MNKIKKHRLQTTLFLCTMTLFTSCAKIDSPSSASHSDSHASGSHSDATSSQSYTEIQKLLLSKMTVSNSHTATYEYNQYGDKELITAVMTDGSVDTTKYTYDEKRRVISIISNSSEQYYTYDDNDRLISSTAYAFDSEVTTNYYYNEDGTYSRIETSSADYMPTLIYSYDDDGGYTITSSYADEDIENGIAYYNSDGKQYKFISDDAETFTVYDEHGNKTEHTLYYSGELAYNHRYENTYDNDGNIIKTITYQDDVLTNVKEYEYSLFTVCVYD